MRDLSLKTDPTRPFEETRSKCIAHRYRRIVRARIFGASIISSSNWAEFRRLYHHFSSQTELNQTANLLKTGEFPRRSRSGCCKI